MITSPVFLYLWSTKICFILHYIHLAHFFFSLVSFENSLLYGPAIAWWEFSSMQDCKIWEMAANVLETLNYFTVMNNLPQASLRSLQADLHIELKWYQRRKEKHQKCMHEVLFFLLKHAKTVIWSFIIKGLQQVRLWVVIKLGECSQWAAVEKLSWPDESSFPCFQQADE